MNTQNKLRRWTRPGEPDARAKRLEEVNAVFELIRPIMSEDDSARQALIMTLHDRLTVGELDSLCRIIMTSDGAALVAARKERR